MELNVEYAATLKQKLSDFVMEAEGELAVALETYCAENLARFTKSQDQGGQSTALVLDTFLTEGYCNGKTPLDLFLAEASVLGEDERQLVASWHRNFTGIFKVTQVLANGFVLMNWMTAKHYVVKPSSLQPLAQLSRLQEGEIVLTRIAPISETDWMFFSGLTLLGKLGKPKLAVAIGSFKQQCKENLYGDAPELLEEAWRSVESSHQEFLDFFGENEFTLPGYQADQQMKAFQKAVTERQLVAAGLSGDASLTELANQADISEVEIAEAVHSMGESMGASSQDVAALTASSATGRTKPNMALPQLDLPDRFKKAEQLTIITHPRWGQMFLPTYHRLKTLLETDNWQGSESAEAFVLQSLADPELNTLGGAEKS